MVGYDEYPITGFFLSGATATTGTAPSASKLSSFDSVSSYVTEVSEVSGVSTSCLSKFVIASACLFSDSSSF